MTRPSGATETLSPARDHPTPGGLTVDVEPRRVHLPTESTTTTCEEPSASALSRS
jgi:hypothetical protein